MLTSETHGSKSFLCFARNISIEFLNKSVIRPLDQKHYHRRYVVQKMLLMSMRPFQHINFIRVPEIWNIRNIQASEIAIPRRRLPLATFKNISNGKFHHRCQVVLVLITRQNLDKLLTADSSRTEDPAFRSCAEDCTSLDDFVRNGADGGAKLSDIDGRDVGMEPNSIVDAVLQPRDKGGQLPDVIVSNERTRSRHGRLFGKKQR